MNKRSEFERFAERHIGPDAEQESRMLEALGVASIDRLIDETVPASIRMNGPLPIAAGISEAQVLAKARRLAAKNRVYRSYIGQGYSDCFTPPVIQRNILENPGWYTQYTPYQAEIAQGRLEALLNFQTMVSDLTGLEIANASLLDEGTAAAEAMSLCYQVCGDDARNTFLIAGDCHPQTIDVVKTRAAALEIEVRISDDVQSEKSLESCFGLLLQYPSTDGAVRDYSSICSLAHEKGLLVAAATDLLSLVLLRPPGEWGADIAVGNSQRFGVPLSFGGPHAAFFAIGEKYRRLIPGRLVGVSKDVSGRPALRLALQTREQHIRREKATSNICTAQVLLAVMASMYAVYHGRDGLVRIADRVHRYTRALAGALQRRGFSVRHGSFFDTLRLDLKPDRVEEILGRADGAEINFRRYQDGLGVSLDETTRPEDLPRIVEVLSGDICELSDLEFSSASTQRAFPDSLIRGSDFLDHPVFRSYRSETELLRYIYRLESRDLSLTTSMIALGSCTMKLNAAAEMMPITWPEFARIHPFAPSTQTEGYRELIRELEDLLCRLTGLQAFSLQPNAGSQGELTGLLAIRAFHHSRGEDSRRVCLIPESAHGTNPASAVMAGLKVVVIKCDSNGNIDIDDLQAKSEAHRDRLAALMVTYPSTHGVFEEAIREIIGIVHTGGGQVYMDGANLNAQLGLCRPGDFGVDVCHLNLHKTFCIPHGGGGPGVGPVGAAAHLAPFLPGHPEGPWKGSERLGAVSAAPWGSAGILPISWAYILLMGADGLTDATKAAILNANYVAHRLREHYPILYAGRSGRVAHECILDLRQFKRSVGIDVGDVARRLMDYGFHAPTVSFPVPETMMVEPTESESKDELDRFCDALIAIRREIKAVEDGEIEAGQSPLKNCPHTALTMTEERWERPYSRRQAAFPAPWLHDHKFWPAVGRIDNVFGDRHLFCVCVPIQEYELAEV